jgi:hypothetical protein
VALTKLVLRGTPDKATCAPLTKLLPVTVRVKFPAFTSDGLTLLKIGVELSSVIAALALAALLTVLTAETVTLLGVGKVCGAMYSPAELMVPSVEFPPTTPFTDQITVELLVPLTVILNCCAPRVRTLALPGVILSCTVVLLVLWALLVPPLAAQPTLQTAATRSNIWIATRILPPWIVEYAALLIC